MTEPRVINCAWQRLTPPFRSEPIWIPVKRYQGAVVFEFPNGERAVVDRDDLREALERPRPRAA